MEKGDNNLENKWKDIASLYIKFQYLYLYTDKKQYNLINQSIDDITRKCDEYLGYYQEFKEKKEKCIWLMNEIQELSQKIESYSSWGIYSKMVDPWLYESIKGNYETQKNNFDPTRYPDFFSFHDALSRCKKALADLLRKYAIASELRERCKWFLKLISKKYNVFQVDANCIYGSRHLDLFPYPTTWKEDDMDAAQDFESLSQELEKTTKNQQKNQDFINSIKQKKDDLDSKNNEYQKLKGHPYAQTYRDSTDHTTITLSWDLSNDLSTLQQKYNDLEKNIKSITKHISDYTPSSFSWSNNNDWTSHSDVNWWWTDWDWWGD